MIFFKFFNLIFKFFLSEFEFYWLVKFNFINILVMSRHLKPKKDGFRFGYRFLQPQPQPQPKKQIKPVFRLWFRFVKPIKMVFQNRKNRKNWL
jgi:hypothetical protein